MTRRTRAARPPDTDGRRRPARGAAGLAALSLALACGEAPDPAGDASGAPPLVRAAVTLEPPRIAIGDVVELEIAVVTPPEHRVLELAPPEEVPGFWRLGVERLPVERDRNRWIHRTRVRLRAHALGRHLWPPTHAVVEGPAGERRDVEIGERPLEVVSVLSELPERNAPFGLRAPAAAPRPGGALLPAAVGAALALAGVAVVRRVQRARRAAGEASAPRGAEVGRAPDPASRAAAGLAAARAAADTDPRRAANEGADALRRLASHHFAVATRARTTEELVAVAPPGGRPEWAAITAALRVLDDVRFRPEAATDAARGDAARRVRDALREAEQALVLSPAGVRS